MAVLKYRTRRGDGGGGSRLSVRRRCHRCIPILLSILREEAEPAGFSSERSRDPVLRERALSRVTADIRHPARLNVRRRASNATLWAFALTKKMQLLRIGANSPFS